MSVHATLEHVQLEATAYFVLAVFFRTYLVTRFNNAVLHVRRVLQDNYLEPRGLLPCYVSNSFLSYLSL